MRVLSLFDGISCARVALDRVGIRVERYFASEIDKYAQQVSAKNHPNIIQVGDVRMVAHKDAPIQYNLGGLDLLIGGSPCQDLSIAKRDRKGLKGDRSGLFYEYVRILEALKPTYFILENVASMSKEDKDIISETLGVQPIMINAALVSAQNRKRLFWVGKLDEFGTYKQINIELPEDRGILLKDILEDNVDEKFITNMDFTKRFDYTIHETPFAKKGQALRATDYKGTHNMVRVGQIGKVGQGNRIYSTEGKSVNLSANGGGRGAKTGLYETEEQVIRKLTPIECERLQGLPDGYTEGVSNTQRYKALGNAFNVDVVAHILKSIK